MISEKFSQPLIGGLFQDGEITAVHDMDSRLSGSPDESSEMGVHFRSPSCQIEALDSRSVQEMNDGPEGSFSHHLRAIRSGIDMAMDTTLITAITHTHLKGLQVGTGDARKLGE